MIFSNRNCNAPMKTYGYWWLSQFRRWGMVKRPQNYKVIRPDYYMEAMKELGVKTTATDMQPVRLADGTFNPNDPEKYAKSFPVHSLAG